MKKRIIGIILMSIVFIPILYLGGNIFKFFIAIVGMQALKELINLKDAQKKIPSFVKFLSYVCTVFIILSNFHVDNFTIFMDFRIISILFVFFLIPLIIYSNVDKYNVSDALYLIGIVLLVGFVFNLLLFIRDYDLKRFIFIVSIAMLTDTFAYISGVLSGREKLCPKISPKKSILGLILGVSFGTIVASTLYYVFLNDSINLFLLLSVTLFLSILSQLGDLVFSSIKRYYNIKDFSNIILGHGGVLDRFDSLVFVIIGYIFFISVL